MNLSSEKLVSKFAAFKSNLVPLQRGARARGEGRQRGGALHVGIKLTHDP
jgi:hypothetical protein